MRRWLLVAAALVLVAGVTVAVSDAVSDEPRRPNIVLVVADDMTVADLEALPRTRELVGASGTTFSEAVVSYALCCPSRATILTGQYAHNHGVRSNRWPAGGYLALRDEQAMPAWLEEAGYHTIHIGKYLNGYGSVSPPTEVPAGWTDWQGLVDPSTYRMYDYTLNDNGSLVEYGSAEADYQTDVLAARAEDAITRFAGEGPFFLQVAPLAPHAESSGPGERVVRGAPRHAELFTDLALPRGPAFDEADVSDKPALIQSLPRVDGAAAARLEALHQGRWRALAAVDELVAGVVGALEREGILDDTVIIVISDNGFMLGEHRQQGTKYLPYEPAIRVPLLARGPGFGAGEVVSALAANVDISPTIAELSGITPGEPQDGISLLALARDEPAYVSRAVLLEGLETDVASMPPFLGVRTATHTYVTYRNGEVELYDLEADPDQLDNLAGRASEVQADLSELLLQLANCAGESCRTTP